MATATTNTNHPLPRRAWVLGALAATLCAWQGNASAHGEHRLVSVWKNPGCGCCKEWIKHLQTNSFRVVAADVEDTAPIRKDLHMPAALGSCHTAVVEDYVIEGHIPGMPAGSPGMEMGAKKDRYQVLLVLENGNTRVYQTYS
jgi:hypothetical protein